MRSILRFICFMLAAFSMFSCNSYKKAVYFQDLNRSATTKEAIKNYQPLTVQPDDILGITIGSMNAESSAVFNFASNPSSGMNENTGGYVVDENGYIQFPVVGPILVRNLTTAQVREIVLQKVSPYLKQAVVSTKLLNFKISILGDVIHPGQFSIQGEKLSIPEALSLAGDLNITALRNLIIIREINGTREYINIDLRSKSLFNSPYYYIKNNDILYAEAGKSKYAGLDQSYQRIGILLSIISVAAIFITR